MGKFKYVGPHDEVEVPALGVTVKRGGTVDASGPVAASLAEQQTWQKVAGERKPRKTAQKAVKKTTQKAVKKTTPAPAGGTNQEG